MKFGLNLFSLREQIKTPEDFKNTAARLKSMGYSYLQFSGAPFNSELIKKVSEKCDIPFYLTHVPFDRLENDTKNLVFEHNSFGCTNLGLGMMQFKDMCDDEIKRNVAKLEDIGKKISALVLKHINKKEKTNE